MQQYLPFFLLICLFLTSCIRQVDTTSQTPSLPQIPVVEVPDQIVEKSDLTYTATASLWTLDGQPYSGQYVVYYDDGNMKEKAGVLNGKKQNRTTQWYPDGHEKQIAYYHEGKLHGEKKLWTSDSAHILISHLNYYMGKAHGIQRKWYSTGELFKKLNLNMGQEEGIQQAFRKNGVVYANYEARNGRIFGMKKAALCFDLEEEQVILNKNGYAATQAPSLNR